jgi:PhnB protein
MVDTSARTWSAGAVSDLTPYLCVRDARAAIAWYVDVLGAEVTYDPIVTDDGRIGHVELGVDGAGWMMSEEFAEHGVAAPDPARGAAVSLHLTVADVDRTCERVVAAGTPLDRGPEDSPPAGRVAVFRDPFGHRWFLAQPPA